MIERGTVRAIVLAALSLACSGCQQKGESVGSQLMDETVTEAMSPKAQLASNETWVGAKRLVCRPLVQHTCGPTGCSTTEKLGPVFVRWTPAESLYERCGGSKPCDRYPATVSYSGSWTNVAVPDRAVLARLTPGAARPGGKSTYVEVATLGNEALIYYGRCQQE